MAHGVFKNNTVNYEYKSEDFHNSAKVAITDVRYCTDQETVFYSNKYKV